MLTQTHAPAHAATPRGHTVLHPVRLPLTRTHLRAVNPVARKDNCENCRLHAVCVPDGLDAGERDEFIGLVFQHKRFAVGERLYRAGEAFTHLYFVKTGAFKSVMMLHDGREQITGFHLAGDMLGIDAIGDSAHPSEAVAIEEAWVCAVPYQSLMQLSRRAEPVQSYVQNLLSRELVRDQGVMLLLGRMQAEERVAVFLINLAQRFKTRGQSPNEFILPMVREDIGNYLGLTLETVSRCLSRLKKAGLIEVNNRQLRILDHAGLEQVIGAGQNHD